MTTETKPKELSDFVATEAMPTNIIQTPTFLQGEFGQAVYEAYDQERSSTYQGNPHLKLQLQDGVVVGSNFFDSILINQLLRKVQGSPRTPLPSDLNNPRVLEMIKDKHYADAQALVLRSTTDSRYAKNEPLARFLAEQEGIDLARLAKEPALMHGFDPHIWEGDTKGYGLRVVLNSEFTIHYDDRLLEKWNGYHFDETDTMGLPLNLDKKKGSRTWYTRKDGLSGLYLNWYLDLGSVWNNLDGSGVDGRVVVVGGEATAPDLQAQ